MKRIYWLLVLLAVSAPAGAQDERVKVTATGQAPVELPNAREAAIEDALRRAVETGGGVEVASLSETRDFQLIRDVIYTQTAGLVETYRVVQENPDQEGLYTVRVEAVISRGSLNERVAAWKSLIRRKGHPRLMVVGSVDRRPFERRLTAEIQGALDRKGLTVIDLDMLSENQRRDAERAARSDLDPQAAALIAREVGADYLVVVAVEGVQHPPQEIYGLQLHRVDATGIVKVIAADTARLIASEVVNTTAADRAQPSATRKATTAATQQALQQAIGRIGEHWLTDVDQRGGQQIELVAHKFPFDRLSTLLQGLRQAGGVKDILVDSTDPQGRSHVRIITNATAADIAAVLTRIDPAVRVTATSKYQVEIALTDSPSSALPGVAGQRSRRWLPLVLGCGGVMLLLAVAGKLTARRRGA